MLGELFSVGFESLTGGGALPVSAPAVSRADSATGDVSVGGLNVPALPSEKRALIYGAVILGGIFLWRKFG